MKQSALRLHSLSIAGSILISSTILSTNSLASGFAIIENSASGMGQAFAGAAAVAEDPSTIFFNPAGMMYLEGTQMTAGLHIVDTSTEFSNKGTTPIALTGTNEGGNAGDTFYIPNFYYVQDFAEKYKIGIGVNAPIGLATDYDNGWMGRYAATKSDVKTVNINPSIAFRANEKLSIGLGMDIQYMEATLKKDINQTYLGQSDAKVKVDGDSWALGFNGGFIYQYTPETRIGMHYRSKISHTLDGHVKYKNLSPYIPLTNQGAEADMDTPSSFSVSMTHDLNSRLTLLGDVTFTEWSNFNELKVEGDDGSTVSLVEQNWDDTYRYSLGLKYQYNEQWIFRTGIARDETPTSNQYRTARIPGEDRDWLSLGASYSANKNLTIDVGYSHLWIDDSKLKEEFTIPGSAPGVLEGEYDADVDILSVQGTWKF